MFEPYFKTANSQSGKTIELLEIERNLGRNLPKFRVYQKDKLSSCRQVFVNATDKESAKLQAKCIVRFYSISKHQSNNRFRLLPRS